MLLSDNKYKMPEQSLVYSIWNSECSFLKCYCLGRIIHSWEADKTTKHYIFLLSTCALQASFIQISTYCWMEAMKNQGFCCLLILTLNNRFISAFLKPLVWSVCTMQLWLQNWHYDICFHTIKFAPYAWPVLCNREVCFLNNQ